jgi:hypothetical protein
MTHNWQLHHKPAAGTSFIFSLIYKHLEDTTPLHQPRRGEHLVERGEVFQACTTSTKKSV